MNRCLPLLLAAVWGLSVVAPAFAQPGKHEEELSWDRNIRGLVKQYCYRCHAGDQPTGDVDLKADENPRMIAANRAVWLRALERLQDGEMPPEDAKQPSDKDRDLLVRFLKQTVSELDCETLRDPGRPRIRRLNRVEYDHSIRYLTGLDLRLGETFSPDPDSYGFDNIADSLTLTPAQVEQYHEAAKKCVSALLEQQVPSGDEPASVFFIKPSEDVPPRQAAQQILQRFARRAFRRPVEDAYVERLLRIYDMAIDEGQTHPQAVGQSLIGVLLSPRFLMRIEQNQPDAEYAYPVDPFDLASRLSFFLWSAPPDEPLLKLAETGELSNPDVLEQQTRRMLIDPRSRALAENFFGQWLQIRELQSHKPDAKAFPQFDAVLATAMQEEVYQIVGDMLQNDLSLTTLIDADFTHLNEPLAVHYGIQGVAGADFRKVGLQDRRRGGVLTTAALLMRQSDPGRTNVPRRGNFIAGTILGTPAPPPPPNVPALEETTSDQGPVTLRAMLELHRRDAQCASCHDKMDPLGFAFENYDAIGQWRDQEAGVAIDASGKLPGGQAFDGPAALKQILLDRREAFATTLARNLTIYAFGRGLELADECVIEEAVEQTTAADYRFSALVVSIVKSYPFTHRRNPEF